jgi:hypothetical protein
MSGQANSKEKLAQNIKGWIQADKEMKRMQKELKELKEIKNTYTNTLVEIMKTNEIDCFDITDGKIIYTQNRVKNALNKKHLLTCLEKYFENKPNIEPEDITKFILENREVKTTEGIRYKVPKS